MKTKFNLPTPKLLSILLSTALLATVCLSSCKKNDNNQAGLSANVMAVNSAQGSAAQDFYVDNNKLSASAIAYTQNTDYVSVGNGSHTAEFRNSTTVNSSANVSFAPGSYNTVFFTDNNQTVVTQDDRTPPASGKARVRFVHLASASAVSSGVDLGLATGAKIVTGLAYKAASAYYDVDAATTFSLFVAGSSNAALNIPTTIQAGKIYTIYVSGNTNLSVSYNVIVQN